MRTYSWADLRQETGMSHGHLRNACISLCVEPLQYCPARYAEKDVGRLKWYLKKHLGGRYGKDRQQRR